MAANLAPAGPARCRGLRAGYGQGDDGQGQTDAGKQDDVDGAAADGEEADAARGQEQPQEGTPDQGETDDDEPDPPVLERDQQQPDADGDQHREQRQLADDPGEERTADVERRTGGGQADSASMAAACSAARTTFCSSIARVIGPTPPGLGATCPATSRTSSATSPAILPSTRLTPTSKTAAPGLTTRSEEHTSELQSRQYLVCRLL